LRYLTKTTGFINFEITYGFMIIKFVHLMAQLTPLIMIKC